MHDEKRWLLTEEQVALGDSVMKFIKENPEKHDQGIWIAQTACGTVGCFAGWVAMESGWQAIWYGKPFPGLDTSSVKRADEDERKSVAAAAADALGIPYDMSLYLFTGQHTVESLEKMWDVIKAGTTWTEASVAFEEIVTELREVDEF
jgi:hypothetical protein